MSGWWVAAAGLAAAASAVPDGRLGSRVRRLATRSAGARPGGWSAVGPSTGRRRAAFGGSARRPRDGDLATIVTLVASRLRAGNAPSQAWADALAAPVVGATPTVGEILGVAGAPRRFGHRGRSGTTAGSRAAATAVVAACLVAEELGAGLATVLDEIGVALAAQDEARADLVAALAGPRSGARVVGWLPVFGALLGVALGADPVAVLLGGGWASAAGGVGLVLLVLGHVWTKWLVARAARVRR